MELLHVDHNVIYELFIQNISRFWLLKTTHIIHHNQLLLTKFGKALSCWSDDVKGFVILNQWPQNNVKSAASWRLLNRWPRKPGTGLCYIKWAEKQRAKWWNSFRTRKYFEWIIKQLLKSAFVGYEEFCRFGRVLFTEADISERQSFFRNESRSHVKQCFLTILPK